VAGIASIAAGYAFYRVSLPFNRENGERFKAIFDLYRDRIQNLIELKPDEKALWKAAWAYLQYGLLCCANCGEYNYLSEATCSKCHTNLASARRNFEQTGKFPFPR
jgi:uncharacterized paraquat-inducible protein A